MVVAWLSRVSGLRWWWSLWWSHWPGLARWMGQGLHWPDLNRRVECWVVALSPVSGWETPWWEVEGRKERSREERDTWGDKLAVELRGANRFG